MIYAFVTTLSLLSLSTTTTYIDSTSQAGKSTYYGGNPSGGACGYADVATTTFPFGFYAACGSSTFNNGYGCGACYEIECLGPYNPTNTGCTCSSTPKVIVSCMDQCPECSDTHFDLDPTAMAKIVGPGLSGTCGEIETQMRRVVCEYTGNIKIRAKSGTSEYWYGLHIDDVAGYGAITQVQIRSNGASNFDTTCSKSNGASYWGCMDGFPLIAPLDVKLTNDASETLTCDGCITHFDGNAEFDFGANFGVAVPTITTTHAPTTSTTTTSTTASGGSGSQGYIIVENHSSSQDYYLSLLFDNIDASSCSDSVVDVQVMQETVWRSYNQYYYEDTVAKHRYAWDYTTVMFSAMEPLSIRIVMNSGRQIELSGIVTDITPGLVFTSNQLICDGTLSPTTPTPQPTTKTPTAPTTAYPTAQSICIDVDTLDWRSYDNELKLNGNRFNMKGLSWFGYETPNNGLYGLDEHNENWYFNWMRLNGFNAMRLPFASDWLFSGTALNSANFAQYKATIQNAQNYGIFVMPDMHSKVIGSWTDGLNTIDQNTVVAQWAALAQGLQNEWNVFIADIFNEPHDVDNSAWGDWIQFTEDAAKAIWATGVNWMVAVEGTNWECNVINCAWGENLEGVRNTGITFDETSFGTNRFIWSPHVYGADVTGNSYSTTAWHSHWGYLVDGTHVTNEAASVIGEFGTVYTGGMVAWLDDLITYLIDIDARNTFFWCLNPNSGDTGGLLQNDWTSEETAKLNALNRLQPNPSIVNYDSGAGQVCVVFEGGIVTPTSSTTKAPTSSTTTKVPTTSTITSSTTSTLAPTATKAPTTSTTTKAPTTRTTTRTTTNPTTNTTTNPTIRTSTNPTTNPTTPTSDPTDDPTSDPTRDPTRDPTTDPTRDPTRDPTSDPTTSTTTKAPTTSTTTKAPTTSTTTSTTTSNSNDDLSLEIMNCPGSNAWWYSCKIINVLTGVEISSFEIRPNGENEWIAYSRYDVYSGCYTFDSGNRPYQLPLDFRITSTENQQIEARQVMNTWDDNAVGSVADNFEKNDDSFISDNDDNVMGLSLVGITVIILCVVALCCIIVGVVYYLRNRRKGYNKNKNKVTDAIAMVERNKNPTMEQHDNDEANHEQTNIVAVNDDD